MPWQIAIAGGGFGGLYAARTLEKVLPAQAAKVTLVNEVNYMLYTPLLPGAAAGTLEPRHVVVPLREELRTTDLRLATVTGADPARNVLQLRTEVDGREEELHYDQLVVALGSVSRTLPIPGLADHAVGFKSLSEAIALRNRILQTLEVAESLDDPRDRRAWLTYVFVGAGYAGLEGLAELQDFAVDVIGLYPRCQVQGMRWILVEAQERVMMEIRPSLGRFAERELRGRGIDIRLQTRVERVTADEITLSGGDVVPARTVAWTAGVKPHPVVGRLGLPLDEHGRIPTDRFMRVAGHENVWAIGDAAGVPDPGRKGQVCPPTAQHGLRQGRTVAHNVAAAIGTGHRRPFRYRTLGSFVDMGRHQAVASTMGIRWHGFPAWFLARTYHLAAMPGVRRRLRLVVDWTVDLLFSRDASDLGQLGHPPPLDATGVEPGAQTAPQTSRGTPVGGGAPDRERILEA